MGLFFCVIIATCLALLWPLWISLMGLTFKSQNMPCLCIRTLALFKFLYQEVLSPQVNGSPEDGGMAWPHLPVVLRIYVLSPLPPAPALQRPVLHALLLMLRI